MANSTIHDLDGQNIEALPEENYEDFRKENEDGSVTLQLKYPVTVRYRQSNQEREDRVTELHIRRANGGDIRQVLRYQKDEEKVILVMFTRLTKLTETHFDALDADDVLRFAEEVERFLPQSHATGVKS
jgi:hypothetical protein